MWPQSRFPPHGSLWPSLLISGGGQNGQTRLLSRGGPRSAVISYNLGPGWPFLPWLLQPPPMCTPGPRSKTHRLWPHRHHSWVVEPRGPVQADHDSHPLRQPRTREVPSLPIPILRRWQNLTASRIDHGPTDCSSYEPYRVISFFENPANRRT